MAGSSTQSAPRTWTASELRQLPASERDEIMKTAAKLAEHDYRLDKQLTAFEAFGEKDLQGDSSTTETR